MHHCGFCHKQSKSGEAANKVVVETRKKVYNDPPNYERKRTPMSFREVVHEMIACAKCASDPGLVKKVGNTLVATADVELIIAMTRKEHAQN